MSSDQLLAAELRWNLPLELLAAEWLEDERLRGEDAVYVMNNLLPTLILGIDKLLGEVSNCNNTHLLE